MTTAVQLTNLQTLRKRVASTDSSTYIDGRFPDIWYQVDSLMQTITKLILIVKRPISRFSICVIVLCGVALIATGQPGPLQTITVNVEAGSLSITRYTPFVPSYYAYYNSVRNDSISHILTDQLTPGTLQTADRVIDVTGGGTYAYRDASGNWVGLLHVLRYGRAFMYANRHEARTITMEGFPADSVTYVFPMPTGDIRFTAPRMAADHPIGAVGLSWSGFHWSQNMRQGGDIVVDLVTRQLARRDSTDGWIGTMSTMQLGHPILIQVNNPGTFDWTYNATRE